MFIVYFEEREKIKQKKLILEKELTGNCPINQPAEHNKQR